jgi:hypothetical protein
MEDCSCIYVDDKGFGPDCSTQAIRKARKTHYCYECLGEIKRGDRYEELSGVWDGTPARYRTCLNCVSVRDAFFCDGFALGRVWEYLYDHFRNCANTTPTEALAKLTPAVRAGVCEFIEDRWKALDE